MTTVTSDDDSQNIYTVTVGRCNEPTSVDESEYEEKRENLFICPGESIPKKEPSKISEKRQCAYTLFLVHINICHNISSGVRKNFPWKFRIKIGCTPAVIFLWDITEKKTKKTPLSY